MRAFSSNGNVPRSQCLQKQIPLRPHCKVAFYFRVGSYPEQIIIESDSLRLSQRRKMKGHGFQGYFRAAGDGYMQTE